MHIIIGFIVGVVGALIYVVREHDGRLADIEDKKDEE